MGNKVDICYNDKISYIGQIKNNKYHGKGTIYYNETGNLYKGKFNNGLKHGFGKLQFYNGDKYIGYFYNDEIQGKGKYISNNGFIYNGNFIINNLIGKGQIYNNYNELIYDGEFLNSLPHGFGISYVDNKISYVGNWNQNFYNGHGIIKENNIVKYGIFQEGKLVEQIEKIPQKFLQYFNIKKNKNLKNKNLHHKNIIKFNPKHPQISNIHIQPQIIENPFNNISTTFSFNSTMAKTKINNDILPEKTFFTPSNIRN
jgi:hypothetical protein